MAWFFREDIWSLFHWLGPAWYVDGHDFSTCELGAASRQPAVCCLGCLWLPPSPRAVGVFCAGMVSADAVRLLCSKPGDKRSQNSWNLLFFYFTWQPELADQNCGSFLIVGAHRQPLLCHLCLVVLQVV